MPRTQVSSTALSEGPLLSMNVLSVVCESIVTDECSANCSFVCEGLSWNGISNVC